MISSSITSGETPVVAIEIWSCLDGLSLGVVAICGRDGKHSGMSFCHNYSNARCGGVGRREVNGHTAHCRGPGKTVTRPYHLYRFVADTRYCWEEPPATDFQRAMTRELLEKWALNGELQAKMETFPGETDGG